MRTYTAEESPLIEDGIYPATVQKIEDFEGGTFGPAYKFLFDVDVEDDTIELSALCSDPASFTPKTKLRRWANAILNREIADGERFSPTMLVNGACRILVKNEETERGTFAKVKDVMVRSKPKKAKPAVEQAPPPKKPDTDVDEFMAD